MAEVAGWLIALVRPLAPDTFAVSAALGMAGLILAGFEMVMPIVGFLGGALVGQPLGSFADYVAAAVLVGAGAMMQRGDDAEGGETLAQQMRGLAVITAGVSVSLDELAIGLVIGGCGTKPRFRETAFSEVESGSGFRERAQPAPPTDLPGFARRLSSLPTSRGMQSGSQGLPDRSRSLEHELLEAVAEHLRAPRARDALRRRKQYVELAMADAKVRHGMHRAQRRGRENMFIQAVLTAATMNLLKLA